ncbi:hypothetical protein GCM10010232_50890 [Streptomyces amakusaensis]
MPAPAGRPRGENGSTPDAGSEIIVSMTRHAFPAARSAVADAPKAAVLLAASTAVAAALAQALPPTVRG